MADPTAPRTDRRRPRRRWRLNLVLGGAVSAAVLLVALVSLAWTPHPYAVISIADRLAPADAAHWLGTDQFGRDLASLLMVGARNSVIVSVVAVGIGAILGIPMGLLASARRGFLDEGISRLNDLVFAFPALLSAVMITALFGPGAVNSIVAIGVFNVPVFARLTRGAALVLWRRDFVLAARAAGKSDLLIAVEHVLPNLASVLIVQATIQFALGILAEAGLSYLGLGTQPPMPSWGKMLAEAQTMMFMAPRLSILPGLAIVVTVLGLNLLGDGLRDALDPRLARRR